MIRRGHQVDIARWVVAVGLLLAACFLPGGVAVEAQGQPRVAMSATAGYGDGGSYIIGEGVWFPVRVTVVNPAGAPSLHVRVEVGSLDANNSEVSAYARELDLPSPARKEVTLYAYSGQYSHSIDVRLMDGNKVLTTVRPPLNPLDPGTDMLLAVASSDSSALNLLTGEKAGHRLTPFQTNPYGGSPNATGSGPARVDVAHISLSDIPPLSSALDAIAALVVDDVDTGSLSPEQHDALAGWVQRGGTLIAVARPGGAETASGLADLLPVKVNGTRTVSSLRSLGDLVSSPLNGASTLVSASAPVFDSPVYGRVLAQQDGVPLAAIRDLGQGQVAYLALSPSVAPLKGWDGLVPLFKRLLVEHRLGIPGSSVLMGGAYGPNYYGAPSSGVFDTYGDVLDLPGLDLPSGWLMAGFLLIYIMLIGPVNFIILRRLRRTELAWATIPALVIVFSLGAYFMAYGAKGGDIIMPRANVTYSEPGMSQAMGVQVWGVFSPLRRNYNLSVGADSLVSQFNSFSYNYSGGGPGSVTPRVLGGGTTTVQNVVVDTGGIRAFVAQNSLKAPTVLQADLHLADSVINGTLKNTSGHALQDVALVRGDAVQSVGYIAPGASVPVKLAISPRPFNNSSPSALLPPPPGVMVQGSGVFYSSGSNSAEQRAYNRKVAFLSMALQPVISNDPPESMDVVAVAWGGDSPVSVDVDGHSTRTEAINLWVSSLPVVSRPEDNPVLNSGAPYWTYQAGNADNPWTAGPPKDALNPYSDVHFMLPPGTKPHSLSLVYRLGQQISPGVGLLVYNTKTGAWDKLGSLTQPFPDAQGMRTANVPNSADYVGPGGDVTVRLNATQAGNGFVDFQSLDLVLNGGQTQ